MRVAECAEEPELVLDDRPAFNVPAGANVPAFFKSCLASPGSCDQGVSDEKMSNPVARFTWQISPRNKFAAYMDRAMRLRGHAMGSLAEPVEKVGVCQTTEPVAGSVRLPIAWPRSRIARSM